MDVQVLQASEHPVSIISLAAGICYGKEDIKYSRVKNCVGNGHLSVVEHATATFLVKGISRACLAQLSRHRLISLSVQSQRYCVLTDPDSYVIPPSFNEVVSAKFMDSVNRSKEDYDALIAQGVKPEDARFVLPQATCTDLVMTVNARELAHILGLRVSSSSQWEIRDLGLAIFKALSDYNEEWALLLSWLCPYLSSIVQCDSCHRLLTTGSWYYTNESMDTLCCDCFEKSDFVCEDDGGDWFGTEVQ